MAGLLSRASGQCIPSESVLCYAADPRSDSLRLYWKDERGIPFRNIGRLKDYLEVRGERLVFAMNGGMFGKDFSPQGLFIENGREVRELDTSRGEGNFYLKPNGVFHVSAEQRAGVTPTGRFGGEGVRFATQSGPMLLIDGRMHPAFKRESPNLNIRNGVCVAPNGKVVFALSKAKVTFYQFATYFRRAGCRDALYLDGYISKAYWPDGKWEQPDGDLGVIIGVSRRR